MKLRLEQLPDSLGRSLMPVYLVAGDEPLLVMQACDQIRAKAKQQGFVERDILSVDGQFDWGSLLAASSALSLFSEQKLLDMRLPTGKPGQQGSKALLQYVQQAPRDKILLIQSGRLEPSSRNAAWFKTLDEVGVVVQVWDLSPPQTLAWVGKRLRDKGLQADQQAVQLLTERVEGNLLAAAQEIDKLVLLFSDRTIGEQEVIEAVSDSSRFSTFDLGDAMLQGNGKRIRHILQVLQQEGTAIQLILWTMTDISRQLDQQQRGTVSNKRLSKTRQALMQAAKARSAHIDWSSLWGLLAEIDRNSKGIGFDISKLDQRLWDQVERAALMIGGFNLLNIG